MDCGYQILINAHFRPNSSTYTTAIQMTVKRSTTPEVLYYIVKNSIKLHWILWKLMIR